MPNSISTITGNFFEDIQSSLDGAGIRLIDSGSAHILSNSFVRLEASEAKGGAIFSDQTDSPSNVEIKLNSFEECVASAGNVLYWTTV